MTYPMTDRDLERLERRVAELEREASRHPVRQVAPQPFAPRVRLAKLTEPLYSSVDQDAAAALYEDDGAVDLGAAPIEISLTDFLSTHFGFAFVDDFLWVTPWTADHWRPVSQGYQSVAARPNAPIPSGSSGLVSVYYQESDTGVDLTAWHEGLASGDLAAGEKLYLTWLHGRWIVTSRSCA